MAARPEAHSDDDFYFVDSVDSTAPSEDGAFHDDAAFSASPVSGSAEAQSDLESSAHAPSDVEPAAQAEVPVEVTAAPVKQEVQPPLAQASTGSVLGTGHEEGPSSDTSGSTPAALAVQATPAAAPSADEVCGLEWSQSECHMQDIRYAEKKTAAMAPRKVKQQLKLLICGQAETGKTTTARNLMASLTGAPDWAPKDISGLTAAAFVADPAAFETRIEHRADDLGRFDLTYVLQEAPPLAGEPQDAAAMLSTYIQAQHAAFAEQEQTAELAREGIQDTRVDVVLYFLPTNARVSSFDSAVMARLSEVALVIPVMCKADCLNEEELRDRKGEMARLIQEGLCVFQFPEAIVAAIRSDSVVPGTQPAPAATPLGLPFMIMAGNVADDTVHPFWFVRKYRWGMCEAYREVDSDLKHLRRLLLDEGFWCLKDAADALYRRICTPPPKKAEAEPEAALAAQPTDNNPFSGLDPMRVALGAASPSDPLAPRVSHSQSNSLDAQMHSASSSAEDACWEASVQAAVEAGDDGPPPHCGANANASHVHVRCRQNKYRQQAASQPCADVPSAAGLTFSQAAQFAGNRDRSATLADRIQAAARAGDAALAPQQQPQAAPVQPAPAPEQLPCVDFNAEEYEMVVVSSVTRNGGGFRLTLAIPARDRVLCMRVGYTEGCCLASAIEARSSARPCTYDSWKASLDLMGCSVLRAVVTKCAQTIFYSSIHTLTAAGGVTAQDARPSDAINLAVRFEAPVYVHRTVIDAFSKPGSK